MYKAHCKPVPQIHTKHTIFKKTEIDRSMALLTGVLCGGGSIIRLTVTFLVRGMG